MKEKLPENTNKVHDIRDECCMPAESEPEGRNCGNCGSEYGDVTGEVPDKCPYCGYDNCFSNPLADI